MENKFHKLKFEDEISLLENDTTDYTETKKYLFPLIENSININRFSFSEKEKIMLTHKLLSDIPISARRYLSNKINKEKRTHFCLYFSWYISETINKELKKQSLLRKIKAVFTRLLRIC